MNKFYKIFGILTLCFLVLLSACGTSVIKGKVVGINGKAPFSGDGINTSRLTLNEELMVTLGNGTTITANCPKELLSAIRLPDKEFEYSIGSIPLDPMSGQFIANITIFLDFDQYVSLKPEDPDTWTVTSVDPVP